MLLQRDSSSSVWRYELSTWMSTTSVFLAPGRWENEAKGIVARPKGSEPISGALLSKTWDSHPILTSSLAGARRFTSFCDEAWLGASKAGGSRSEGRPRLQ